MFVMIAVLAAALVITPTVMSIMSIKKGFQKGLESQARGIAVSLAEVSPRVLEKGGHDLIIQHNAKIINGGTGIRYLIIEKSDGTSLVQTSDGWEQRDKPDPAWGLKTDAAGQGRIVYSSLVKEKIFHYSFPLQSSGTDRSVLHLGFSLETYYEQVDTRLVIVLISSLVSLTIALLGAFIIARHVTRPILVLRDTADRIVSGDPAARAHIQSGDEVQDLAESFNRMTDNLLNSQAELMNTRDHIENVVQSLAECLIVFRADRGIEMANTATTRLLGYPREELIGRPIDFLFLDYDGFLDDPDVLDRNGSATNLEKSFMTKDGKTIPVLFSYSLLQLNRDAVRRIVGIALDITEQKNALTLLEKSREEAVQANRAKSEFLANMSHEIRTPMNGVLGMLDMLINSPLGEEQRKYADTAYRSADTLLSILNDILDLSKIEAGRMELECVNFDVREALEEVARLFSARVKSKLLRLELAVDQSVFPAVCGDAVRFRQVLVNLVGNAVKFTDVGEVSIKAMQAEQDKNTVLLRLEVKDTGVGIKPEAKEQIFESFIQADPSTTRRHGGTGLGLSISKKLVTMMGGEIGVASEPGKGSTFWFTVRFKKPSKQAMKKPRLIAEVFKEADHPRVTGQSGNTKNLPADQGGTNHRILLAEDNSVNQQVIITMLSGLPFTVEVANNGVEALEILSKQSFDCVLMDCQMPELDGYEATKLLRERENRTKSPRIPVIALTANAMQGDREKCLASGMDDYLPKPFYKDRLVAMLNRWLIQGGAHMHQEFRTDQLPKEGRVTSAGSTAFAIASMENQGAGSPEAWPIDRSVLNGIRTLQSEGAPDLVSTICSLYLADSSDIIQSLDEAVTRKITDDIFRLAHKLKSSSANVGALRLSDLLKELEMLGHENKTEGTESLFAKVRREYEAVRKFLEREVKENSPIQPVEQSRFGG